MRRSSRRFGIGTALAVTASTAAAMAGVGPTSALAAATTNPTPVHCGEIILVDTVVANDLHECPDIGLAIGAPDITLDLNGHTIEGNGEPVADCPEVEPCNTGITNSEIVDGGVVNGPGFAGVTITNGIVRGFAGVGVYEFGVKDNRVDHVRVEGTDDGVILYRSTASTIDHVTVSGFRFVGFVVSHSHDIAVTRSSASHAPGDYGFLFNDVNDSLLQHNRSIAVPDSDGIGIVNGSNDNTIRANTIAGNGGGIGLVDSARNLIASNDVHDNIYIGIYTVNADANRIIGNRIARNSDGSAGGLVIDAADTGTSDGNVLARNRLIGNVGDGILVVPGQGGTRIEDNLAHHNTADGIDVQSSSTSLGSNTANHNGVLGIDAVLGVIDEDNNRAAGNGDPRECVGVVCR